MKLATVICPVCNLLPFMTYMIEAASSTEWRATAKRRASYRTTRREIPYEEVRAKVRDVVRAAPPGTMHRQTNRDELGVLREPTRRRRLHLHNCGWERYKTDDSYTENRRGPWRIELPRD